MNSMKTTMIFLNECLYMMNDIDVFEGIYVNKTSASKECDTCHYWFFEL